MPPAGRHQRRPVRLKANVLQRDAVLSSGLPVPVARKHESCSGSCLAPDGYGRVCTMLGILTFCPQRRYSRHFSRAFYSAVALTLGDPLVAFVALPRSIICHMAQPQSTEDLVCANILRSLDHWVNGNSTLALAERFCYDSHSTGQAKAKGTPACHAIKGVQP